MSEFGQLIGWKAIAGHLGVGVRTAQDYEKDRGLPVYHQPGPKGRVFANPQELDGWRTNGQADTGLEQASEPEVGRVGDAPEGTSPVEQQTVDNISGVRGDDQAAETHLDRRKWIRASLWGGSAALGLAGLGLWAAKIRRDSLGPPTAYRVEGATLIVSGKNNVELWRHTFPLQIRTDAYNLRVPKSEGGRLMPPSWFLRFGTGPAGLG